MEIVAVFMIGAMVGIVIVSLAVISGRCAYEEEVRKYYEAYCRKGRKDE